MIDLHIITRMARAIAYFFYPPNTLPMGVERRKLLLKYKAQEVR